MSTHTIITIDCCVTYLILGCGQLDLPKAEQEEERTWVIVTVAVMKKKRKNKERGDLSVTA